MRQRAGLGRVAAGVYARIVRVATWNCNGRLRDKLDRVRTLAADVLVVPESSREDIASAARALEAGSHWAGAIGTKGLGVLVRAPYRVASVVATRDVQVAFRVVLDGPEDLEVVAVWACGGGLRAYTDVLHAVLDAHGAALSARPCVLAGDLNSNARFDRSTEGGHTRFVARLHDLGYESAYHAHHNEAHGAETRPTFFMNRKRESVHHLDYVFVPRAWLPRLCVEVGAPEAWLEASDHSPVTVSA